MTLPYIVRSCDREDIKKFIEIWHYSKSINGIKDKYNFKLLDNGVLIGAAIFAGLAMAGQYKKYCDSESDIIELRRLCCIDDTLKNTESFFISRCLRWLKQYSDVKYVISYADPNKGHTGIIYKASNFQYAGLTSKTRIIKWNGKIYHDHAVRTKYRGKLKPFAKELLDAVEAGLAIYEEQLPKHCFLYEIRNKKRKIQATLSEFEIVPGEVAAE